MIINTQLENTEIIRSDGNEFLIYMIGYNENQIDNSNNDFSSYPRTKKISIKCFDLPK